MSPLKRWILDVVWYWATGLRGRKPDPRPPFQPGPEWTPETQ